MNPAGGDRDGDAPVRVVAKVALHPPEAALLRHEAAMYARAGSLQGGALPRVFGVFASRGRSHERLGSDGLTVLVMSHRGGRVELEAAVSSLYITLEQLHKHGVSHGDLRAENVVVSRAGVPSLIDLSHARAHVCGGEAACKELSEARAFFGM
ncbi:hypothetical protein B0H19DRAFT_922735 [Mycena capillaripes]|nr:hypothetical protein B0H19DRAFT_922735 [Mycena capillaripes]